MVLPDIATVFRQALFLLQQCGHSVEEAMRRTQMNNHQQIDTLSLWSEEECANFENGLRFYGKDFYTIQQQKVGHQAMFLALHNVHDLRNLTWR